MIFQHAWKELKREHRFSLLFLLNLALGLSGLVTMDAFRQSLSNSLKENALSLLGADLSVSVRRPFTEEEKKVLEEISLSSSASAKLWETFSMVKGPQGSRLVLIKGMTPNYPLRGKLELGSGKIVTEGKGALAVGETWLDPDLARQLGVKLGESVQVGTKAFRFTDVVSADPTQTFRGMALGGRMYLRLDDLVSLDLIRPESTASYVELFALEKGQNARSKAKEWTERFSDRAVRVRSAEDAADDTGRLLAYLGDFLGLAALVALFLSGLGASFLLRTWLTKRSKTFALQQILGLSFSRAICIPLFQVLIWALFAVPLALALALLELKALEALIAALSPVPLSAEVSWSTLFVGFLICTIGALSFSLPLFAHQRSIAPKDLLQGTIASAQWSFSSLVFFLPGALFFSALALWQANSYRVAGLFLGALLVSLFGLLALGYLFLWVSSKLAKSRGSWIFRQALLYLSRRGALTLSAFVALALGTLLLNLLPQLRAGLASEIERPTKLPSLFLFDIQEEQLEGIGKTLGQYNLTLENQSPLIRARLLRINEREIEREGEPEGGFTTREEEQEARFRNRGVNLTFASGLKESEAIIEGRAVNPSPQDGVPEVSVEKRYAGRLDIKIGDRLSFDVQGVPIEAKVVNLRSIRWTSFQPNFFIVFPKGVLEDAPKIYLGSLPALPDETKSSLQSSLAENFPNVSVVDIRSTVDRGLAIADRMRWALNLMSAIALFAGLLVLYSIAERQADLRRWEINLCRVLGARKKDLQLQQIIEFGFLGFVAGASGALISLAFAGALAYFLFDSTFMPALLPLIGGVTLTTVLAMALAFLSAQSALARKPAELLGEQAN
jgi:putative ABC transport system permease protein